MDHSYRIKQFITDKYSNTCQINEADGNLEFHLDSRRVDSNVRLVEPDVEIILLDEDLIDLKNVTQ